MFSHSFVKVTLLILEIIRFVTTCKKNKFRMTYKEEGRERSIFDDTVIIFTSTNGALTPEVQYIGKTNNKNVVKIQLIAEPWSRRGLKRAPERQPGRPAGRGNQDSCIRLKFGQGLMRIAFFLSLQNDSSNRHLER